MGDGVSAPRASVHAAVRFVVAACEGHSFNVHIDRKLIAHACPGRIFWHELVKDTYLWIFIDISLQLFRI